MGFTQSFVGAISGTFYQSWDRFTTVSEDFSSTTVVSPAVLETNDNYNIQSKNNIVKDGAKIVVPEGYALITVKDGKTTGFITEQGGYVFTTKDEESQSIFTGDFLSPALRDSWNKFKSHESCTDEHKAFFINVKRIKDNKFNTKDQIVQWEDGFLNSYAGAKINGRFSLKIVDPILFIHNFLKDSYVLEDYPNEINLSNGNNLSTKLCEEISHVVPLAMAEYSSEINNINQYIKIDEDLIGFGNAVSKVVEDKFKWMTDRGIMLTRVVIDCLEYDQETKEKLNGCKNKTMADNKIPAELLNKNGSEEDFSDIHI